MAAQNLFYELFAKLLAGTLTVEEADQSYLAPYHRQVLLEGLVGGSASTDALLQDILTEVATLGEFNGDYAGLLKECNSRGPRTYVTSGPAQSKLESVTYNKDGTPFARVDYTYDVDGHLESDTITLLP